MSACARVGWYKDGENIDAHARTHEEEKGGRGLEGMGEPDPGH